MPFSKKSVGIFGASRFIELILSLYAQYGDAELYGWLLPIDIIIDKSGKKHKD